MKNKKKKITVTLLTTSLVCTAAIAGAATVYAAPGNMGSFNSNQSFSGQTTDSTAFSGESTDFGSMTQSTGTVTVTDVSTGTVQSGSYENADAVTLTFSDSGITASGDGGYEIDGTTLKITESGTYILTGSCSDGTVVVKKGVTGVTIVLNGLSLTSSDSAPITCNKSSEVTIYAAEGSVNYLADTEQNNDETYTDNENAENAVIKCKDGSDVTISGTGTINIVANGKNGIKSGATTDEEGFASLTIEDVTLNITAYVNDGINAEAELNIESGTLTISAADDAIHCDLDLNIGEEGTDGPDIMIESCCEGLEGATIDIYSGDIDVTATDDGMNAANSDLTGYTFELNIYGGDIYIDTASGDGIDSNGAIYIYDGNVEVFSQSSGDNSPLDSESGAYIYGGTVLGVGCSGMGESISSDQATVTFNTSVSAGSTLTVKDANGNTVYSAQAVRSASYVIFSSEDLTSGSSYTLYVGSSAAATATASTGTSSASFGGMGTMTGSTDMSSMTGSGNMSGGMPNFN